MYFFSLILCVIAGIIMGIIISKNKDNEEYEFHKRVPSKEEILYVLHTVRTMYRCSPHEDDCMKEAIRLIKLMEEDADDDE